MADLSIGMRVKTTPSLPSGVAAEWAGLFGVIVDLPGDGNVRVEFEPGRAVTCGISEVTPSDGVCPLCYAEVTDFFGHWEVCEVARAQVPDLVVGPLQLADADGDGRWADISELAVKIYDAWASRRWWSRPAAKRQGARPAHWLELDNSQKLPFRIAAQAMLVMARESHDRIESLAVGHRKWHDGVLEREREIAALRVRIADLETQNAELRQAKSRLREALNRVRGRR